MYTLDFNVGETNNCLRFELKLTQGLLTATYKVEKDYPQAQTTVSCHSEELKPHRCEKQ